MAEIPALKYMLDRMPLVSMAGQLFMPAAFINDNEASIRELEQLIRTTDIGGLCFFHSRASAATNFEGKKEIPFEAESLDRLKSLIQRYQEAARYPLLISIDAEWGLAMRIENTPKYPYALALGALPPGDPLLYQLGLRMAADCRAAGIHWNLAPVVDVNTDPANPVIGYRSFGSDPVHVSKQAIAVHEGMRDGGLLTCIKHFPGHGDTSIDSHLDLPVLDKSLPELEVEELLPFRQGFQAGVPAVMTGHLAVPTLDATGTPASMSAPIIKGLLREKLGFQGLVMTDALNMHAVSKRQPTPGMTAFSALEAGNDLLCFAENIPEALQLIVQKLPPEQLRESFGRVWALKEQVFNNPTPPGVSRMSPATLNRLLAAACLCDSRGCSRVVERFRREGFAVIGSGPATAGFEKALDGGMGFEWIEWDLQSTCASDWALPENPRILLALAPPALKPPGNFGISDPALVALRRLFDEKEVLLYHFGNPYVLNLIPAEKASGVLIAFQDLPEFQARAAMHFNGKARVSGQLPISLKNLQL